MAVVKLVNNSQKKPTADTPVCRKTVLKYMGYTALVQENKDGHFVAEVKDFPGEFYIHAGSLSEVKNFFHQFAALYKKREKRNHLKQSDECA